MIASAYPLIYAAGQVRLPLQFHQSAQFAIDDTIDATDPTKPEILTIVNTTPDRELRIFQPTRLGRQPQMRGGIETIYQKPPPGPLAFILSGGLKSSWIVVRWSGRLFHCWQPAGMHSEDFEQVLVPEDYPANVFAPDPDDARIWKKVTANV